jgi:hypothetical protein
MGTHDPGGKRLLKLPPGTRSTARFGGPDDCYRYELLREWDGALPAILFVMMNPSTADVQFDDSTVAKCGRLARAWGFGALLVGNTFAYRCTDQRRLTEIADPIGPENDDALLAMARDAAVTVFAYGKPAHRLLRFRGLDVAQGLARNGVLPHVLKLTADGTPGHPLYMPEAGLRPVPWRVA